MAFVGDHEESLGPWGASSRQGVLVAIVTRWQHFGWAGNIVGLRQDENSY